MRLRGAAKLTDSTAARSWYLEPAGPVCWLDMFGNANAVEVEVGCGKGLFLLTAAAERPGRNFLGIEIARKYAQFVADRAARRGLTNVRVARADARQVIRDWIAESSVAVLHVYFPDPWWKRRHKKRRLFTAEFVHAAARVLHAGGELRIATDVEEYFSVMCALVAANSNFTTSDAPEPAESAGEESMQLTNFELKYRKVGKPIWRAAYARRA
jgi:tRNA (guanine-N7-)-methyltransferase